MHVAGGSWFGSLTITYAIPSNGEDEGNTTASESLYPIVSVIEASCWGVDADTQTLTEIGSGSFSLQDEYGSTNIYSTGLEELATISYEDDGEGLPALIVT